MQPSGTDQLGSTAADPAAAPLPAINSFPRPCPAGGAAGAAPAALHQRRRAGGGAEEAPRPGRPAPPPTCFASNGCLLLHTTPLQISCRNCALQCKLHMRACQSAGSDTVIHKCDPAAAAPHVRLWRCLHVDVAES